MSDRSSIEGRTAVVTGAGAGLGRAEALSLAAGGADVVVNDIGSGADDVVAEIKARGRDAVAVPGDIGEWSMADRLVEAALDSFGSLDIVVNNAGITRDRMLFNLTEPDWDDVVRVHLKGHAALARAAAAHWRSASKAADGPVYGRLVNTASEAFLLGGVGQANYAAAKAGITALTLSAARGLARYGVRANAICPRARTAMTADVFDAGTGGSDDGGPDPLDPDRVGTFVHYLASPAADAVNGQVFVVYGAMVALMAAPTVERTFTAADGRFSVEELDDQLAGTFADRDPARMFAAFDVVGLEAAAEQRPGR